MASILLPAYKHAQEEARKANCIGQLKQIGLAVQNYTSDYGDHLPVCGRLGPGAGLPGFSELLRPYLRTDKIFRCPADTGSSGLFAQYGTSYEWNVFYNGERIAPATMEILGYEVTAPIVGDGNAFHGKERNYLYTDGRVTSTFEMLIQSP